MLLHAAIVAEKGPSRKSDTEVEGQDTAG